jgi:hypothetical protein
MFIYLKSPRLQKNDNNKYSKKIFLDAGAYAVDRVIKEIGYLCFTGNSMNSNERTLIREKDCREVDLEGEAVTRLYLLGSH